MPAALTAPPAPAREGAASSTSLLRATVIVLTLVAIGGALAWYLVLSPFSFRRWSSLDIPPSLSINEPGTYVLYEEFTGAATSSDPSSMQVSLRSIGGRKIDGTSLIGKDGVSSDTYHTPFHEGRALRSFVIDKPGVYTVFAFSSGNAPGSAFLVANAPKLALAPEGRPGWVGGLAGLVPLVVLPALTALALGIVLFRHQRRDARNRRPGP